VKRLPVDTVCDQATSLLKPTLTIAPWPVLAPMTSICPGTVRCICQKRFTPIQGKCGLPSSSPLPLAVVWRPNAQALEPSGESSRPASRMASAASARFSGNSVVVAAAVGIETLLRRRWPIDGPDPEPTEDEPVEATA